MHCALHAAAAAVAAAAAAAAAAGAAAAAVAAAAAGSVAQPKGGCPQVRAAGLAARGAFPRGGSGPNLISERRMGSRC